MARSLHLNQLLDRIVFHCYEIRSQSMHAVQKLSEVCMGMWEENKEHSVMSGWRCSLLTGWKELEIGRSWKWKQWGGAGDIDMHRVMPTPHPP